MNLYTSNSDLRPFLKRFWIFILPLVVIIGSIEGYLWYQGETVPLKEVLIEQRNDQKALYMRGLISQDFNTYKYQGIIISKPEILVVGSSRVMNFRKELFKPHENKFYNAGGILQSAHDLVELFELIKQNKLPRPKMMIVGLDPWWYKMDAIPRETWLDASSILDHAYEGRAHLSAVIKLFQNLPKLWNQEVISGSSYGIVARYRGGGFREDGSKRLDYQVIKEFQEDPVYVDRENPPILYRITNATTNRFSISENDTVLFQKTIGILNDLKELNIEIVVYLPPFSQESYLALEKSTSHRSWWDFNKITVPQYLDTSFGSIIPIRSPNYYNLNDTYFIDGIHPSEVMVGEQWLHYLENGYSGSYQFDKTKLKHMIRGNSNPLVFAVLP